MKISPTVEKIEMFIGKQAKRLLKKRLQWLLMGLLVLRSISG